MEAKKLRMLIVDDEVAILNSLKFLFRQEYEVHLASSGEQAWKQLHEEKLDIHILLSDQRMADMQGHELLKKVHDHFPHIVTVLITGYTDMDSLINAVNQGHIYSYIGKPWNPQELRMMVGKATDHYRLNLENLRLAHELRQINRELEQRVIDRTAELNEQKLRLLEANKSLMKYHQQTKRELDQARLTQLALLPQKLPEVDGMQVVVKYVPVEQLGGDVYDMFWLDQDRICFLVADVTGHGVPAALISSMVIYAFRSAASKYSNPETVLEVVNGILCDKIEEGKFVTVFYGVIDLSNLMLNFTVAGHPPGFLLRTSTQEIFTLRTNGTFLGAFSNDLVRYQSSSIELIPGDKVFAYTDAPLEMTNEKHEMFGLHRLENYLIDHFYLPVDDLATGLFEEPLKFARASTYRDDFTLLGFELL